MVSVSLYGGPLDGAVVEVDDSINKDSSVERLVRVLAAQYLCALTGKQGPVSQFIYRMEGEAKANFVKEVR